MPGMTLLVFSVAVLLAILAYVTVRGGGRRPADCGFCDSPPTADGHRHAPGCPLR